MDKVVKEYKKSKQCVRRLGRAIRKLEKKEAARKDLKRRLIKAREETKKAKADGARMHARIEELMSKLEQAMPREESSVGIDMAESDQVAEAILGTPENQ